MTHLPPTRVSNDSEYIVFFNLINSKAGLSVKDLVEKSKKDRTTVQKILSNLLRRELLMKRQINRERGYMCVYFSKNKKEILDEIEKNVESYFEKIKSSFQNLRS